MRTDQIVRHYDALRAAARADVAVDDVHALAAVLALALTEAGDYGLPADPFTGALLVSGLYDLAPLRYSYLQPMIQLDEGVIARNSPAFGARSCATPMHLVWGGREQTEFERQSLLMHSAWQAAGNAAEQAALPGCDHFSVLHGLEDPQSDLCQRLQRLSA